jgi:cytochrome b561
MISLRPQQRYSRLSIALHWVMLLLIALTYAFVELRELFPRGTSERAFMRQTHFSLGLCVLALVGVRLLGRWRGPLPPITPRPPAWQRVAAALSHGLLYGLMIGMPLAGWFILSLRGDPIPLFGLELPPLVEPDEALAKVIRGWHGDVGRVGYGLIGLHALAAIWHHTVLRDDTLRRILPAR